jgi:hypothetical protein
MRLQELSLRSSSKPKFRRYNCNACATCWSTRSQLPCAGDEQLEQSDAEEAMSEWLESAGVENAYKIGPALVAIGFERSELDCARRHLPAGGLSDALNWLEALVSSVSLVCAIEESIGRISDLVMAVKKFAYDDRCTLRDVDVHDSIQSTLTILGHKMRQRQISVVKHFDAEQPIFTLPAWPSARCGPI